jgi:hypothetical protein
MSQASQLNVLVVDRKSYLQLAGRETTPMRSSEGFACGSRPVNGFSRCLNRPVLREGRRRKEYQWQHR